MPTIEDIKKARIRIHGLVHETPIFSSSLLNNWLGHEIYFKAECLQKIGAFKARGACNTLAWLVENKERPEHVIANSSGNHSQAVAWAARQFNIPATIYMPAYASKIKIQATQSYGAHVELCKDRNMADALVIAASKEKGAYWIPPYNHHQVIAGQGTAICEAIEQVDNLDAVFAPCGGGGLLSGTLIATHALSPKTQVIGVEPLNANDAAQSLRTNRIQKLSSTPDTLADGAMTMAVGDITFEYLKLLDALYEVEEPKLIYWTQWLTHLLKLHVEPTSAMAMAGVVEWLKHSTSKKRVMVILSGGNIDPSKQNKIWNTDYLDSRPCLEP
ncbi:serine/threonine dehydratase [Zobellia galactanivorans]|uniref:serine/threonine dehydratase n=1 Tax=Zobellia galactanivorans (strain DSM 12802 / CCUG 47099 / CIP 106680 / NCIMB 13871 / Dsij) TaxID=63186 RepID=UPI002091C973|nr:serine/threonine dehydratase [Zobellia galactanivorans]MDO6807043.1 serine/threonine dehydratase [Zobellia galactanivorans]